MSRTMLCRFLSLAAAVAVSGGSALAAGWGTVEGQIVLDGKVPAPEILVKKGDPAVKDSPVCAAQNRYSQELVVNPENNGIANVCVYLKKAPSAIHPDQQNPPKEALVFDQKGCMFIPHVMVVRTGQTVDVKSDDPVSHNTHTHPLRNTEDNFIVPPNDRKGVPISYNQPEPLPTKINCDIHPHMTAYWLIVDHPYAAVTDADGKFRIENLPEGEHTLAVWQEKVGYLDRVMKKLGLLDKAKMQFFMVSVKDGQVTKLEPLKVPTAVFQQ